MSVTKSATLSNFSDHQQNEQYSVTTENSEHRYDLFETLLDIQKLTDSGYTGSLIPHIWFQQVTFPTGKPDLLGMFILADIVYWYRAVFKSDESTGRVQAIKKKFKADMLQRSIGAYAEQFGVSKRQVTDALTRLSEKNLIIRELRTISTAHGNIGNVLFLAPNGKTLLAMQECIPFEDDFLDFTNGNAEEDPYVIERIPSRKQLHKGMQSNAIAYVNKRDTYTKTTTKISTKNKAAAEEGREDLNHDDHPQSQNAAAAFEKNDEEKNNAIKQPSKTASAYSKQTVSPISRNQVETTSRRELTPTKPLQAESLLGDELTHSQQALVRRALTPIAKFYARDLSMLVNEVATALLDSNSFKKTGRDFHHKLNAIVKEIKAGRWCTPAKCLLVEEQQAAVIAEQENTQHKERRDELQQQLSDRRHWEKMLTFTKRGQDITLYRKIITRCDSMIASLQQKLNSLKGENAC